jgi:hypothetical protein
MNRRSPSGEPPAYSMGGSEMTLKDRLAYSGLALGTLTANGV